MRQSPNFSRYINLVYLELLYFGIHDKWKLSMFMVYSMILNILTLEIVTAWIHLRTHGWQVTLFQNGIFKSRIYFSNRINYLKYWKSARPFCSDEGRAVGLGQVRLQGRGSTKVTGLVASLVATPLAGQTRLASSAAAIPLVLVGAALSSVTLYTRKFAGTMGKKKTRWKWREVLE